MTAERLPDFIIAGAPKCGTTALYEYLRAHPGIFLPEVKEPHYFCSDFQNYRSVTRLSEYLSLFRGAADDVVLGEGSVWYLYSEVALPNIMATNPRAKIIVMLRNPVEMVYSLHSQQLHALDEDVKEFKLAWDIQEARARGLYLPKYAREPKFLQYKRVCSYSSQIARLLRHVPDRQRLILIFEEFRSETKQVYEQVLKFLDLPSDGRSVFPRVNSNVVRKSMALAKFMSQVPESLSAIYPPAKRWANRLGMRPGKRLEEWNTKEVERAPLDGSVKECLAHEFAADVHKLEILLGRSLAVWR